MLLNEKNLPQSQVNERINKIYRSLFHYPLWEKQEFYKLLKAIYEINKSRSDESKIRLICNDVPFNWNSVNNSVQYEMLLQKIVKKRDSIIALNVINSIEQQKGKIKCLMILNYRHAFKNIRYINPNGKKAENVIRYLIDFFPNRVKSIMLNQLAVDKNENYFPIQNGLWDAAFKVIHNKEIGFDLYESPFGKDSFDLFPMQQYKSQLQGDPTRLVCRIYSQLSVHLFSGSNQADGSTCPNCLKP